MAGFDSERINESRPETTEDVLLRGLRETLRLLEREGDLYWEIKDKVKELIGQLERGRVQIRKPHSRFRTNLNQLNQMLKENNFEEVEVQDE